MNAEGLATLDAAVRRDLQVLEYPSRSGVRTFAALAPPSISQAGIDASSVANVAIIGGGQSGLAVAAALKLERVDGVRVFEEHTETRTGPWLRFARMHTLRTPKNLPGPNNGVPNLSVRRWYEAAYGEGSWDEIGFISKEDWSAYMGWYRRILGIEVDYETRVESVEFRSELDLFELRIESPDGAKRAYARRVVLATGIEGSGAWRAPDFIADHLPDHCWAHTSEDIDFEALRGKRVGVLGAGASGFDNAAVALETGAASVDLCFRRPELVRVNTFRWAEFMGFLKHFPDLSDAQKWRYMHKIMEIGQLPPHDTYHRAKGFENFTLRPGTAWTSARFEGGEVVATTSAGELRYDFVIAATGFRTDLALRKELATFSDRIALWSDRYTPPEELVSPDLARHPYLGEGFEFLPRDPADHWISRIHNYTYGCIVSLGFGGASITGMKYSVPRVVSGITRSFYLEDAQYHFQSLCDYDVKEF